MRRARFKRRGVLAVGADIDADELVCLRDGRVEIRGLEAAFDHDIGRAVVMHARRAGLQRLLRVDNRRQFSNLDRHRFGDILGLSGRRRDDGGDRLAGEAHHVGRQDRLRDRLIIELVQHRPDRPHAVEIGGAINARSVRRGDADDAAGGNGAADEAHPKGGVEIAGEAAAAGHQRRVFQPADGAANPFHSGAGGRGCHGRVGSIGLDMESARHRREPGIVDFCRFAGRFELKQRPVDEIEQARLRSSSTRSRRCGAIGNRPSA